MYTNTAIMTYITNTQERGSTNDRDYKLLFFFKKKKKQIWYFLLEYSLFKSLENILNCISMSFLNKTIK